jgi:hypothetical protein
MPQRQGDLLLSLGTKHVQRLRHIPLACEEPLERPSIAPSARDVNEHVFAWCYVSRLLAIFLIQANVLAVFASPALCDYIILIYTWCLSTSFVGHVHR